MKKMLICANPYMPLWEHVPDGEPRVFTYNGETRVYVYGSHDTEVTEYCGRDYVVWSAPVDDLTDWKCHGTCYRAGDGSILYAPDVVQKGDTFYMYAADNKGDTVMVARSKTPWGPFTDPVKTDLGFDPGVLVDDDGRVYAFWGFCKSFCGELNDDMATIKEGTYREHLLGHATCPWPAPEDGHLDTRDGFFEASSPRKVLGKYVLIYSKKYEEPIPELGIYESNNGFLSYKWCDTPLGDYVDGGDISFNGGEIIPGKDAGSGTMTYQWGNNHGSIVQIKDKWFVFYHRQTGMNEYSRQAMMEPVEAALGADGRVYIGKVRYENGTAVAAGPVEMTSQGPNLNGIDARTVISAGYACHMYDGSVQDIYSGSGYALPKDLVRAHIVPTYNQRSGISDEIIKRADELGIRYTDDEYVSDAIVDIPSHMTFGYRYLQFGEESPKTVTLWAKTKLTYTVNVHIDSFDGPVIAVLTADPEKEQHMAQVESEVTGKHAVYFEFISGTKGLSGAEFDRFTFD